MHCCNICTNTILPIHTTSYNIFNSHETHAIHIRVLYWNRSRNYVPQVIKYYVIINNFQTKNVFKFYYSNVLVNSVLAILYSMDVYILYTKYTTLRSQRARLNYKTATTQVNNNLFSENKHGYLYGKMTNILNLQQH